MLLIILAGVSVSPNRIVAVKLLIPERDTFTDTEFQYPLIGSLR